MRPGPIHVAVSLLLVGAIAAALAGTSLGAPGTRMTAGVDAGAPAPLRGTSSAVSNFTASIDRLVDLVALAGSGILALVWSRVALSWFSNNVAKKVQAKERARDALIGTLVFVAAITGLVWGLAQWVLTGT